jgi:hypothetical protein
MSAPTPCRRTAALVTVAPLLPEGVRPYVGDVLERHPVVVRLARPRRTKLGDHRPPGRASALHRISINTDLNPWAFLTTLLHEVAHAAAWERCRDRRRRIRPHGREWQDAFAGLLEPLVAAALLPEDVAAAVAVSIARPRAATCSDRTLLLALRRYDEPRPGRVLVEELPQGAIFRLDDGRAFRAGRLLRSRRQCFECRSGREYRVHGLAQVEAVPANEVVSGSVSRGRTGRS